MRWREPSSQQRIRKCLAKFEVRCNVAAPNTISEHWNHTENLMKESPRKPPIATDNELLMRFARRNDHQAFRELVERHADMVMAVCRQVTSQQQDAEDAFQTAFVILA